ncbi:SMI1/KNR4 family protein [Streptomyces sp. OS603R]|uniref:SMI1/KNR4 family protein n=1 Tax=Streptomyces sp. OS603R TaxID=3035287 RepID=UPI00243549CF|nr:SMI1/KNR4 family protein [Streptomyces sp. OS603R]
MSDRSLSPTWLASWASRVSETLKAMTGDFERRHGFPSGVNEVRLADHADQAAGRTLTQVSLVAADLVTFYDSIGEVTCPDVGNGYFVDPAVDVLLRFKQYGAVDVGADQKDGGLVIGSNGGGLSYVVGPGGVIYRTRTASLDEPELDQVADDLGEFLEQQLERSLTPFVANGEPGCL